MLGKLHLIHYEIQPLKFSPSLAQVVGPIGLLYVFKREFAVTYPHDNKVSLIGSDEVTTDLVVVVRHTGKKLRLGVYSI